MSKNAILSLPLRERVGVRGSKIFYILLLSIFFVFPAIAKDIDSILILKSERKMYLMSGDERLNEYDISLGFEPIGAKEKQGDGKTPEGVYKISGRNPHSKYHKSLRVSYPNAEDVKRAKQMKVDPGGDIMIHGLPNGMGAIGSAHLMRDWTLGCVAVTSDEIDEIWKLVKDGTKVDIRP